MPQRYEGGTTFCGARKRPPRAADALSSLTSAPRLSQAAAACMIVGLYPCHDPGNDPQ